MACSRPAGQLFQFSTHYSQLQKQPVFSWLYNKVEQAFNLDKAPGFVPRRFVYKKIPISIIEAGKYIGHAPFVLDKNIKAIHAITLTADDESRVFNLTHRVEINGQEILPQEFEARVIYAYASVPVNDRYFDLGAEPAGNGVVKINCYDTTVAGFVAYNVNFYLKCELS